MPGEAGRVEHGHQVVREEPAGVSRLAAELAKVILERGQRTDAVRDLDPAAPGERREVQGGEPAPSPREKSPKTTNAVKAKWTRTRASARSDQIIGREASERQAASTRATSRRPMRSSAFSSTGMLVAKEMRTCPGAPKPEPGPTATPASVRSIPANP